MPLFLPSNCPQKYLSGYHQEEKYADPQTNGAHWLLRLGVDNGGGNAKYSSLYYNDLLFDHRAKSEYLVTDLNLKSLLGC
jgi:hypothetical protein